MIRPIQIAAAAFAIALMGAGPTHTASPHPAVIIHIKDFAYAPLVLSVHSGDTVTWINDDSVDHSVTAADHSFDSGELGQGKSWSRTFDKSGTYAYYCDDHAFMKATIQVTR